MQVQEGRQTPPTAGTPPFQLSKAIAEAAAAKPEIQRQVPTAFPPFLLATFWWEGLGWYILDPGLLAVHRERLPS